LALIVGQLRRERNGAPGPRSSHLYSRNSPNPPPLPPTQAIPPSRSCSKRPPPNPSSCPVSSKTSKRPSPPPPRALAGSGSCLMLWRSAHAQPFRIDMHQSYHDYLCSLHAAILQRI
jgi:hypothetical protein